MARSRNIKPGLFDNDLLAECDCIARLLFIGMWTIADKSGRMEYRPKRIKAKVLPYDDCDIEGLILQLDNRNFLHVYEVDNIKYIQIVNFEKHQHPHVKETPSIIPAPDNVSASTVLAPDKTGTSLPDSLIPLTDSLNPIKDGGQKTDKVKKVVKKKTFTPPTEKDVQQWAKENNRVIDAVDFVEFYGSKGWMVGKNKMVKWKLAAGRWARKNEPIKAKPNKSTGTSGKMGRAVESLRRHHNENTERSSNIGITDDAGKESGPRANSR